MSADGKGGIPSGSAKIDITLATQPSDVIGADRKEQLCVDGACGLRYTMLASSGRIQPGLSRMVMLQIPHGGGTNTFMLTAYVADPMPDAERNTASVVQIIASLRLGGVPGSLLTPTPTVQPTWTPVAPLPVAATSGWLTYTLRSASFHYPTNWYVKTVIPGALAIMSSFPIEFASGTFSAAEVPSGQVAINLSVLDGNNDPSNYYGARFCWAGACGVRNYLHAPCAGSDCEMLHGLNRMLNLELPRDGALYGFSALIANPPAAAERYAAIAESIIQSFQFIR